MDYFYRKTDDMLFQRPLAFSTAGRPYNWENIGSMRNEGVEFELNVDIFKKRDFQWTVSIVGSHYSNEVLTLPEENKVDGITSGSFKLMEGKSRYEYFTYMYAGMNEKGQPQWYMDVTGEDGKVTREKTTTYSNATKYFLGKSALPDFNGGLSTVLKYKGIDPESSNVGGGASDVQQGVDYGAYPNSKTYTIGLNITF